MIKYNTWERDVANDLLTAVALLDLICILDFGMSPDQKEIFLFNSIYNKVSVVCKNML